MFVLKKLSIVAAAVFALLTLTIGGGIAVVRTSQAQDAKSQRSPIDQNRADLPDAPNKPAEPTDGDRRRQEILRLAHRRFETRHQLYLKGEISLEQLLHACEELEQVESSTLRVPEQRKAASERALARLKDIESTATAAAKAGHVAAYEVDGITIRRMQLELDLNTGTKDEAALQVILKRLSELERKVEQLEKRVPRGLGGST